MAVEEYEIVTYPGDLARVGAEIKIAETDVARSEDRVEWAKRMFEKKYVSEPVKLAEESLLQKCKFVLEQAQSKRHVLVDYTKSKTIKELQIAVEKARLDEAEKEDAWYSERAKATDLERQLRLKID